MERTLPFCYFENSLVVRFECCHFAPNLCHHFGQGLRVDTRFEQLHAKVQRLGAQPGVEHLRDVLNVGPDGLRLLQTHVEIRVGTIFAVWLLCHGVDVHL